MNTFGLSASDLLIWGIVLHLIADWPLQNDWMANNKQSLDHPASGVHSGIHCWLLAIVFGWVAIPLAIAHMFIDTRRPVVWWSKLIGQTQPKQNVVQSYNEERDHMMSPRATPLYDVGLEVRFWTDQVFHIICIAVAAVLVTL